MKKFIKRAAVTTLSVVGILSAMPSAFCAPFSNEEKSIAVCGEKHDFATSSEGALKVVLPSNEAMDFVKQIMLKSNIIDEHGNFNKEWVCKVEYSKECKNFSDGCKVSFVNGGIDIVFEITPQISESSLANVIKISLPNVEKCKEYVKKSENFEKCSKLNNLNISSDACEKKLSLIKSNINFIMKKLEDLKKRPKLSNISIPNDVYKKGRSLIEVNITNSTMKESASIDSCPKLNNISIPNDVYKKVIASIEVNITRR